MSTNGIPIKLKMSDAEVTTVYFASVRKCPDLKGLIKAIGKLDRDEQAAARVLLKTISKTTAENFDWTEADEAAVQKSLEDQERLMMAKAEKIQAFFLTGLRAAGYNADDADMYLPFFNPDRYLDVAQRSLVGCGDVDFFSPTPRSTGES